MSRSSGRWMLAALLLTLSHGCTQGSRFEDCEEYLQCLADPSSCTELVVAGPGQNAAGVTPSLDIIGTIPAAIGNLTALTNLTIGSNGVSGTIPETIGLLTMLQSLLLASAAGPLPDASLLSGTLPLSLGNLTRLETLLVYQTQISGTLPPSLGELTALQWMSMSSNSFTGVIPETIGELTALTLLSSHDNHLSGTLSQSIGKLTALTWLQLSNNKISGTVPDALSALTSLTTLYLQDNNFIAVGGGICAIQNHLTLGCDLSDNDIPGTYDAKGGKMNCPVCLNDDGNCNKHNQGTGGDEPVFPNKACDFTSSSCACFAPSPSTAPTTIAPTMMSHAVHPWEQLEAILCFGFTNEEAPHCAEVVLAVLIGAVLALTCVFCLYIVIARQARRDSILNGTSYVEALGYAFTSRCCSCYTQRGRDEHARRTAESASTVAAQTDSTLEVPFLNGVAVQGVQEGPFADVFSPSADCYEETQLPRREVLQEVVVYRRPVVPARTTAF